VISACWFNGNNRGGPLGKLSGLISFFAAAHESPAGPNATFCNVHMLLLSEDERT
jgi:hypothetical protein